MTKVKNPHENFWGTEKQPDHMKISELKPTGKYDHVVKFKQSKKNKKSDGK